jgi:acyl carrier protein
MLTQTVGARQRAQERSASTNHPDIPYERVRDEVVEALAALWGCDASDIEAQASTDGDVAIDSKEAEVVIARIEKILSLNEVRAADLRPEELTSLRSLTDLLHRNSRPLT